MTILPTNRSSPTKDGKIENAKNANVAKTRHSDPTELKRRNIRKSTTPEPISRKTRYKQNKEVNSIENIITSEIKEGSGPAANPEDSEEATGFNSEDEYDTTKCVTDEDWISRDKLFARSITELGYEIKEMNQDGACLFRAIADQIFGDQELHNAVRTSCMDYIQMNKDYFAPYVTEDFEKYITRKRIWNVHGNHLEIQAMSEMYNRTIEVYCYKIKPINIFNSSKNIAYEPIRISYHRMCHYNSIINPNKPSVGVGLGLPGYKTVDLNKRRMLEALRASEDVLIEQTMLEDKLKATDWEATSEALENAVARESYLHYLREAEEKNSGSGLKSRRGSVSPKGIDASASSDNWEDVIMAQILAESRTSYLEDLKRNSKNQCSPGPSTSK